MRKLSSKILLTIGGILLLVILFLFALNNRYATSNDEMAWYVYDKWTGKSYVSIPEAKD